ncbi:hypothetical protein LX36DRAFT_654767 [Colletotrichum falcatum]|nr:hypothetical protein LX36DRAFT_654767 [Colletotrichum falcatum]
MRRRCRRRRDSSHGRKSDISPPLVPSETAGTNVTERAAGPVSTAQPSLEYPWTSWSRGQDPSSGFPNEGPARLQPLQGLASSQAHDHFSSSPLSRPGAFFDLGVRILEVLILRRFHDWSEPQSSRLKKSSTGMNDDLEGKVATPPHAYNSCGGKAHGAQVSVGSHQSDRRRVQGAGAKRSARVRESAWTTIGDPVAKYPTTHLQPLLPLSQTFARPRKRERRLCSTGSPSPVLHQP